MAGNYMTMPITPLFRDFAKYRFQNNEATYAYSSEIQKGDSLIKDVMTR
jgi:hypothetical protein